MINWLALAGWGTSPKSSGTPDQPDGAMTMDELIQKVKISTLDFFIDVLIPSLYI